MTRQATIAVLSSVVVAPATRKIRGLPSEVRLGVDDGMPADCALSFDSLVTVPKALFTERICTLSTERLPELCPALDVATGCD